VEWVQDHLSVRVKSIRDIDELNRHWLQHESSANHTASESSSPSANGENVKVLLLTHLINPPLFLAALSIKFTGRIKFGMFSIKKEDSDALRKKLKMLDLRIPSYVIITPERTVVYGRRRSEHFNFASMNLFLRTVHPEMNDVFLCSLFLVNMLVILQIFQVMAYNDIWMERVCRGQLKCDGTRTGTRFRLSAKRTSPFKSAGASVQSATASRVVRISGSNAGYTMSRGSMKGTGYPLHSPVSPSLPLPVSPCAITFQLDSTVYIIAHADNMLQEMH
jgi:hypothetical protein